MLSNSSSSPTQSPTLRLRKAEDRSLWRNLREAYVKHCNSIGWIEVKLCICPNREEDNLKLFINVVDISWWSTLGNRNLVHLSNTKLGRLTVKYMHICNSARTCLSRQICTQTHWAASWMRLAPHQVWSGAAASSVSPDIVWKQTTTIII